MSETSLTRQEAGGGTSAELRAHSVPSGLLYAAPCDLAAATRALNRYQQAIRRLESP